MLVERNKLESVFKERYNSEDKIKEGYYIRYRKPNGKTEIKVYYNGIKAFELNDNKLELNVSVFLPNSKNILDEMGIKDEVFVNSPISLDDMKELEKNFTFEIKEKLRLPFSTKKELKNMKKKEELFARVKEELIKINEENKDSKLFIDIDKISAITESDSEIVLPLNRMDDISYKDIYKLKYDLVDFSNKFKSMNYKNEYTNDFQGIKFNISCTLKEESGEFDLDNLEKIMEERINIYVGELVKSEDFKVTKGDLNQEKQIQQEFMVLLNGEEHDEIIASNEKLFSKNAYPFELEYTLYAGVNFEENEDDDLFYSKRMRANVKGRIDNVFVDENKIILVEVKYGTGVIDGTNGIHKHLIDIYSCLVNEEVRNKNICEISKRIEERYNWLHEDENYTFDCKNMVYYIICFYNNSKEELSYNSVKNKINSIIETKVKNIEKLNESLYASGKVINFDGLEKFLISRNIDISKNIVDVLDDVHTSFQPYERLSKEDEEILGYQRKEYLIKSLEKIKALAENGNQLQISTSKLFDELKSNYNSNLYDYNILDYTAIELIEKLDAICPVKIVLASMENNEFKGEIYKVK